LKNWEEIKMLSTKSEVKKHPKLSVVVIAYNNELYIEEALESLHEQTFKDMEVVVVNDFSSDRTGELIDRFIEDKPNFKAIHREVNSGGCSTPRNIGIENTTSDYLMFLDGDDWYPIDACEKMVAAIERTKSDFVAGQAIRTNTYQIWYYNQIYSIERTNINIREFNMLLFDSLSPNKIYQRSFLDKHKLRFPEGIHYEDVVFTGQAYFLANSVSIIPELVYYWRVVENADVKSISNRRFEFDNFRNRIVSHRQYDKFLKESGNILYQGHKNNRFLRHDLKLYTNDYLLFDDDYKNKFHKLIYEYMHEVMDEYSFLKLPEKERIMYYLLYIGDKEAFQDYVSYINGQTTASNRIYTVGNKYYFKASVIGPNNEKFLHISQLDIDFNIRDIKLTNDSLSFNADLYVNSIEQFELTHFWQLKNRLTKETIQSHKTSDGFIEFDLGKTTPGNYYLSLHIKHKGNYHRRLVKATKISNMPNIKVEDRVLSKALFINKKNSFAIQVLPLKTLDKISWMIKSRTSNRRKKKSLIHSTLSKYSKALIKRLPVRSNWVLFESHMGKQYTDSPKYIYEELYKTKNNLKYVWSFENPESIDIPGPAIKVKRNTMKHYYYMVRSKFWVDNQGIAHLAPKKKQQVYLQTWHGTPLKKMGYDQNKLPSQTELKRLKIQTNAWDYFISPNSYSTTIFKRAFRYGGNIIESGYPRNDILVNQPERIIQKTKEYFQVSSGKKVILFAPTFRDWDPNSFQKTLNDIYSLSKEIGEESIILLRLHYLLLNKLQENELPTNVVNASTYHDIQELYLISDVLITDYSSVMFDYALLGRPIILYCYDLQEYVSRRGTYFDLEEKGPGPICDTIEKVIYYLNNPDSLNEYKKDLMSFSQKFGNIEDGNATKKVIEQVFN